MIEKNGAPGGTRTPDPLLRRRGVRYSKALWVSHLRASSIRNPASVGPQLVHNYSTGRQRRTGRRTETQTSAVTKLSRQTTMLAAMKRAECNLPTSQGLAWQGYVTQCGTVGFYCSTRLHNREPRAWSREGKRWGLRAGLAGPV